MVDSILTEDQQLLYKLLVQANNKQTEEIKETIHKKIEETNAEIITLKERCLFLERKVRKNNVVIFGFQNKNNPLESVLSQLNSSLDTDISTRDINNYYFAGKSQKAPFVLEFVSYLKKITLFSNKDKLKNLKALGLAIAYDLCPEDQETQKTLRKHLQIARTQNHEAKIIKNKLVINQEEYTVSDLKQIENQTEKDLGEDTDSESNTNLISRKPAQVKNISITAAQPKPLVQTDFAADSQKRKRNKSYVYGTSRNTRSQAATKN